MTIDTGKFRKKRLRKKYFGIISLCPCYLPNIRIIPELKCRSSVSIPDPLLEVNAMFGLPVQPSTVEGVEEI
jgi:hypothetical protein